MDGYRKNEFGPVGLRNVVTVPAGERLMNPYSLYRRRVEQIRMNFNCATASPSPGYLVIEMQWTFEGRGRC